MTALAPSPQDDDADDAQFYRALVRRLVTLGADMAEQVHGHATTQMAASPDAATVTAFTKAFDEVSLCVRKGVLLARHLAEPACTDRTTARQRIIRIVEDVIQREDTIDPPEKLHAELRDRLDSPDLEADLSNRPVDEIIADIIRDLGLAAMPGNHHWKRRTPADVAALRAWAANPARPAAAPMATPRRWPPAPQTRPP